MTIQPGDTVKFKDVFDDETIEEMNRGAKFVSDMYCVAGRSFVVDKVGNDGVTNYFTIKTASYAESWSYMECMLDLREKNYQII